MYIPEIILGIIIALIITGLAVPQTRPYVLKYWYIALGSVIIPLLVMLGKALNRPQDPHAPKDNREDDIVTNNKEKIAQIEADLAIKKVASQAEREQAEAVLEEIRGESDRQKRLERLAQFSNKYK